MSDERQTNPWLGDIWELGYTRHPLYGLVCHMDGDTFTITPATGDMTLQDEDSVVVSDGALGFPVVVWPRMRPHVDRCHMGRRAGRFGFRTIRMLDAGKRSAVYGITPAEHPAAPHSTAGEGIADLFLACLFLNKDARIHARKRLEAMHATAAGM